MFHDGIVGDENDLAVGEVLIHRESGDRADRVTHSDAGDVPAYGVDGAGGFVPEARRVRHGCLDVLVIAPHRLGAVDTDRLDLDANLSRARSCDLFIDEFEDFWSSGLCELDGAGHRVLLL